MLNEPWWFQFVFAMRTGPWFPNYHHVLVMILCGLSLLPYVTHNSHHCLRYWRLVSIYSVRTTRFSVPVGVRIDQILTLQQILEQTYFPSIPFLSWKWYPIQLIVQFSDAVSHWRVYKWNSFHLFNLSTRITEAEVMLTRIFSLSYWK